MCVGDDRPYETIYMQWEKEVEEKLKQNLQNNTQLKKKMTMQLAIPDEDEDQDDVEKPRPKPPQTAVNTGKKFANFEDVVPQPQKSPTELTNITFQEKSKYEYLMNRDPMQEFFTLTCQSIKLNSPHMNTICSIDTM